MAVCKIISPFSETSDSTPDRGDSYKKALERGVPGVDPQVRLSTHSDNDHFLGRGIGVKNTLQGRDEQVAENIGIEGGFEALWKKAGFTAGGKNHKKRGKQVPQSAMPPQAGYEVRCGEVQYNPKWVELVKRVGHNLTPQERDNLLARMEKAAASVAAQTAYLSRPAGNQVIYLR